MITLNGTWQMNCKWEDSWQEGQVPGTVYTDLLRNGQMKDPYVGENEDEVRDLSYNDYTYRRTFKRSRRNLLRQLLRSAAGRDEDDHHQGCQRCSSAAYICEIGEHHEKDRIRPEEGTGAGVL